MKISNPFFKKKKNIYLHDIFQSLNLQPSYKNQKIDGINDLSNSSKNEISFFNSLKYQNELKVTKSKYIITHVKYKKLLDSNFSPIYVENILKSVANITYLFYPNSLDDLVDFSVSNPKKHLFKNTKFGKNVLIGKSVKIGKKTCIGHNSIIESNVIIGDGTEIGNNVLIKNSIIGNNVKIQDGAVIGKNGFGFFPNQKKNKRYPHVGIVIIGDHSEIGCNNTIDRGSISNTIIGSNTFIDNQVHIAHNVKIGNNCIITGQVGFAGSSKMGNNVQVGGQSGISGHVKIGNNVKIGGGSGVIKNIPDNSNVMGYPAKDLRNFLKENK